MIQITPTAAQEIKRIQRSRNATDSYLRLGLSKGGCLDFIYQFSLENDPQEGDQEQLPIADQCRMCFRQVAA